MTINGTGHTPVIKGPCSLLGTVGRQTDLAVTIGQCDVYDRYLACAILMRHKTLSEGEVRVCLLP